MEGLKQKEWRLFRVSNFVSFHRRTLITRKMVEKKAFLVNPKHLMYPNEKKAIMVPNHENYRGCYTNPYSSHLTGEP